MIRPFHVLAGLVFLTLSACGAETHDVSFRKPVPAASSGSAQSTDFTNEGMPKTTDSLEVPTGTGAADLVQVISGGVLIGDSDAPVLTVTTDYSCEYCRQFVTEGRPGLERGFVDGGRLSLKLVFLPHDAAGVFMAKTALCAARQNLFAAADKRLAVRPIAADRDLPSFALKTGLNLKTLRQCIAKKSIAEEIRSTVDAAGGARVPSFKLNAASWLGLMENDELNATIDRALRH